MPRTFLVVPTGSGVGLTSACLALIRALDEPGVKVGYASRLPNRALTAGWTRQPSWSAS